MKLLEEISKSNSSSILLALTLLMYPFSRIFSLGQFEPGYIVPGGLFAAVILWNVIRDGRTAIPTAFKFLTAFALLAVVYNIGYTVFGNFNHLYNCGVYIFLSLFFFALYYYIKDNPELLGRLFLITTGFSVLAYIIYFLIEGFTIGHNTTFMYNINQFAFWAFLSFIICDILPPSGYSQRWLGIIQVGLLLFVLCTLSRSASAGLVLYIILKWSSSNRRWLILIMLAVAVVVSIYLLHDWLFLSSDLYNTYYRRFFMGRELSDFNNLLYGRGFLTVIENPKYLLLGAGEGNALRFGHEIWIHNSILNILFSYGIIGLVLFLGFLKECSTKHINAWIIMISLILSSLFTEITHNLFFWIILGILLYYKENKDLSQSSENNSNEICIG